MSHRAILTRAVYTAIAGGWDIYAFMDAPGEGTQYYISPNDDYLILPLARGGSNAKNIQLVIFNHDFAKALWGDEDHEAFGGYDNFGSEECYRCKGATTSPEKCWQFHLQQMVIADDPIKYLGEHL